LIEYLLRADRKVRRTGTASHYFNRATGARRRDKRRPVHSASLARDGAMDPDKDAVGLPRVRVLHQLSGKISVENMRGHL
jgi:hypothetical protein